MRHNSKLSEKFSRMGEASQKAQANKRLASALNHRPTASNLVFELHTHNPRTGQRNHLEIMHEITNGNSRYNVVLNGERWRKQWSRTGFVRWLFVKIGAVRVDWA